MYTRRILGTSSIAAVLFFCFYWLYGSRTHSVDSPDRLLVIPRGTCLEQLATELYQKGYITHIRSFLLVARLLRYHPEKRPGVYRWQGNRPYWHVIRLLRAGIQCPVNITLYHSTHKADLAAQLTQATGVDAADFEALLQDEQFLAPYGFTVDNVLAMFIPNTYAVYWTITATGLFARMYAEFNQFWNARRREQASRLGLTPIEVAILASIVQCESNKTEELSLIAGVYLNRLSKGMKLQACPTVLYAQKATGRRVRLRDTQSASPYNTYYYTGLPPGPITLPTIKTIEAVLQAKKNKYVYFVLKEDFSGYHYFSQQYREHLYYAKRYHQARNRRNKLKK